ncbi:glycosyltransferase family 2 protein [uncultured Algibacter sp.]|uniref:glycosyltransferase family 2 protein n=1 Tax=uncultured Algibacter sp. TaxID=298659 RepID=UPI00261FFF7E|nr:glycosyltransferase family 2 protein [uncultured Algibacter sp.]
MKLSVVILNYNVQYFLHLCLKSVYKAVEKIEAEIIVVDNNSHDNSCKMVREVFPEAILIENKENFGFSKANNIGVSKAKGEYICILNPDTVVSDDTFIKLLEFSNQKDKLGVVGCKLLNGVGSFLQESKRNIPSAITSLKKILGFPNKYYANNLVEDEIGEVDILVGAFMFIKRTCYEELGGFDEDYFMYGEDIDLSYRMLMAGYKNYYFGKTSCIHFKGESTLRDKNYARNFYGAMQIFYKKHFSKNSIFDLLIWIGIKLSYFIRQTPKKEIKNINRYLFISDQMNYKLQSALKCKVLLQDSMANVKNSDEVIFNANFLNYKNIIEMIENSNNSTITYKILPDNSNFIIGSDNATSRGEVIHFQ